MPGKPEKQFLISIVVLCHYLNDFLPSPAVLPSDVPSLARHGFKPYVVSFPSAPQVLLDHTDDFPQRQLRNICASLNVPVLDLLPILRAHAVGDTPPFYDQCHHTPDGSRVVAEAIYTFLTAPD